MYKIEKKNVKLFQENNYEYLEHLTQVLCYRLKQVIVWFIFLLFDTSTQDIFQCACEVI